jgi:hypothetical protein
LWGTRSECARMPSMPFDRNLVEARLALNRIGTTDLPKLAWDALEAGLDGPATRRLAALRFPTIFEVRDVLPKVMREWQITELPPAQAALRLAKHRAQEILKSSEDPLRHARDFEHMWHEADYCRELGDYGNLADEVHLARFPVNPKTKSASGSAKNSKP